METRSGKKVEPPLLSNAPTGQKPAPQPSTSSKPTTRAAVPGADRQYDLEVAFPKISVFRPSSKLPTLGSTVGMLRFFNAQRQTKKGVRSDQASREVAKILTAKWYHDTLPCIDFESLVYRLEKLYREVITGSRDMRRTDGKKRKSVEMYKQLVAEKDKLYDIFEENETKRKEKEQEWGVSMGKMEEIYLADMRSDRKMECGGSVDPVWYQATMKKRRQKEMEERNKEEMARLFQFKPLSEIEELLDEDGDIKSTESVTSVDGDESDGADMVPEVDELEKNVEAADDVDIVDKSKKKKVFLKKCDVTDDSMPSRYRHVRISERKVRDDVYKALANLTGEGLSLLEAAKAVVEVANSCFDRTWKIPSEDDESYDLDTMPNKRSIREMLQMLEAQSMDLLVDKMEQGKAEGRTLTHYTDSSTKKHVGTFNAQGIHIGKDNPFPLPILPIEGETTDDIAMQTDMAFSLLAAVRGVNESEIYKLVDVHMTDITEHNKGFSEVLAEIYSLDKPAGQLFCSSHTTLGLARAFNKVVKTVEAEMELEKVVHTFMVDLEVDSKSSSVAGQALDMCLKLVAPEYSEKMWNRYKEFVVFLKEREVQPVLFAYKDARFGCLSRAAAVLLHHWTDLKDFLAAFPGINNRLACLVREVMELSYLIPVFVVWACFGVHLVGIYHFMFER